MGSNESGPSIGLKTAATIDDPADLENGSGEQRENSEET
jgi:hypothetical protein